MKGFSRLGLLLFMCLLLAAPARADTLTVWTVSDAYRQGYEAMAAAWNEEARQETLKIHVSVFTPEQICSKLAYSFANGTRFSSDALPDLVDVSFLRLPDYVSDGTSPFFPLDTMLDGDSLSTAETAVSLYRQGSFCFALPYAFTRLVLCCRTEIARALPEFDEQASSFEGLAQLALAYHEKTGRSLIQADYLGGELFLALYGLAGKDPAAAADWMGSLHRAGALSAMPCGSVQAPAFSKWMAGDEPACFVASAASLALIAREAPQTAAQYTLYPLPGFQGNRLEVDVPAVGTALPLQGGHITLARKFLAFARLSPQAADQPLLWLNDGNRAAEDWLEKAYALSPGASLFPGLQVVSLPGNGVAAALVLQHPWAVLSGPGMYDFAN